MKFSFFISVLIKKVWHRGGPAFISIEPTSYCNLSCRECYRAQEDPTSSSGFMNLETYKKIIDSVSRNLIYLNLYFQGEPLLHPDFSEMVSYARRKNIYVATATNAHFLDAELSEKIIKSGLNRIIISFDGPDEAAYRMYREKGNWNKVIAGIKNLTTAREKMHSPVPFIVLQCIITKANEHRLDEVKNLFKESGADRLEFKTLYLLEPQKTSELLPENPEYSRYRINPDGTCSLKKKLCNHCFRSWSSCVITCEGKVIPCCYDKKSGYSFGNIDREDFAEIWKSEIYREFREKILQNRKGIDICGNCIQ